MSTDSEFLVEFSPVPRKKVHGFRRKVDERLESTHRLIIDRRTNLPKQWRMVSDAGTHDRIAIYERIDLKPAKRDLQVVLTGYQDSVKVARAAQEHQPPAKDDGGPFQTIRFVACCFRVLLWDSSDLSRARSSWSLFESPAIIGPHPWPLSHRGRGGETHCPSYRANAAQA